MIFIYFLMKTWGKKALFELSNALLKGLWLNFLIFFGLGREKRISSRSISYALSEEFTYLIR